MSSSGMSTRRREELLYQVLGSRIKMQREGRFTQGELADVVGASRTSITNLESGRQRPPLHLLLRIAEALDCELRDILPLRSELGSQAHDGTASEVRVMGDLTP